MTLPPQRTRPAKRRARRRVVLLLAALPWLVIEPGAADAGQQARERQQSIEAHIEQEIAKSGVLYVDPELDAYLQSVLARLFPDRAASLRVRVLRLNDFNAFALTNGQIYFNTGTLLRLEDEAGLAAILGHEGTHVVDDHAGRYLRKVERGSAWTEAGSLDERENKVR